MSIDFFDLNWKHQPFHEPRNFPFADEEPKKPKCLEHMQNLARKLAGKRPFTRIDFYANGETIYFGEITFYSTSGMGGFDPKEWDYKFGKFLELPINK